ncbi:hypothetical protein ACFY2J_07345 [Streptomyces collinus]|uniref:hypothetical protein n=1 Tax=Streptomyces collinus TaxID=42684 RepID=UPI0036AB3170
MAVRKLQAFGVVAALTAVLISTSASASSASAAQLSGYCHSDGSEGSYNGQIVSRKRIDPVYLYLGDTAADGHHAAIRLVTMNSTTGAITYWPWHHIYGGKGDSRQWTTYAEDKNGIEAVNINVGVFEGDQLLTFCDAEWQITH